MVMEAVVDAFDERSARRSASAAAADPRASSARSARIEPTAELLEPPSLDEAVARPARRRRPPQRRLRRRAQVPARLGARAAARPRRDATIVERDPRRDGGRRHLRPARRRLRPLLGRRRLARPPLREDALRQRPARPRLPARLAGARPRALPAGLRARRSTGCCARCAAPRAASTRRSTPTPRARRAASTSGRRSEIREVLGRAGAERGRSPTYGVTERGQLRGHEHPPPRRRRGAPSRRAGCDAGAQRALRGARRAGLAGPRRQAADLLERADDRRPRRGRRGARPRATTSTPPAAAPTSCSTQLRDADGRLLRTYKDGEARLNAYLEDHAFLLEALLTLYEATFERALVRGGAGAGRRR